MIITLTIWIIRITLLVLLLTPLILKGLFVDDFIYNHTGIKMLGITQVLANDAIVYSGVFLLFYLSFLTKSPRNVSIILRILGFFVLGLCIIDYIVITNFNNRLVISDAIKYASYSLNYVQQIVDEKKFLVLLATLGVAAVIVSIVFSKYKIERGAVHALSGIVMGVLLLTSPFFTNDHYVHSWAYKNVFDYNLTILSESAKYSNEFITKFDFNDELHCYPKAPENPNIIILMVESLSSYQSKFFSGIRDWTPNLDLIASRNIAYKNFYANGFTTEDGEISLLTGRFPIYPPSSYTNRGGTAFNGFYDVNESLPDILKQQGYTTEFLTPADLEFSNTGGWARNIGFDYIEGHEHAYYDNWDRFHFKAAPDEALYNRVLDRVDRHYGNRYFLFIKTASTHHPFINPSNRNRSEPEAFRYADKQIGVFYKRLIDRGFFDKGILIIVGDHHSMIPLKQEEVETFGSLRAAARVPLVVSYGDKKQVMEYEQYQQTDVFHGLKGLVSDTQCHSNWIGDVFNHGKNAGKYVAFRRGDHRNIIAIFSKDQDFLVKLDGDRTRILNDSLLDKATSELIVNKINAVRIANQSKQQIGE